MDRGVNSKMKTSLNAATAIVDDMALCASISLEDHAEGAPPDWVHLLPAGQILTHDGRGPYVADLNRLAANFTEGTRLVLDENHSTDLAAPNGLPAPAMGWIVQVQVRDSGLWGRVEWTDAGKALVASKAYRGISPVLQMEKGTNRVLALQRASLVNLPNIKQLVALHQENTMNPLLAKLLGILGLATDTSEETLIAAVTTLHQAQKDATTTLQSIAGAAGIKAGETVTADTVLNAVKTLKATPGATAVTELQTQLATVTTELNTLKSNTAKDKATVFVDGAIKEGRVGVKALRDHYIEQHMADPARVEKEIAAFPKLTGSSLIPAGNPGGGDSSLNASELAVIEQLGLDRTKFIETRDGKKAAA